MNTTEFIKQKKRVLVLKIFWAQLELGMTQVLASMPRVCMHLVLLYFFKPCVHLVQNRCTLKIYNEVPFYRRKEMSPQIVPRYSLGYQALEFYGNGCLYFFFVLYSF